MTNYKNLVEALRRCDMKQGCFNANCRYSVGKYFCDMDKAHKDAADAIEALNRLLDQNTQRCEELRKQLRGAHDSYEKHLSELEAQLPKLGEWQKAKPHGVVTYSDGYAECSHCHEAIWLGWGMNFCPHCGTQNKIIDPDDYDVPKMEEAGMSASLRGPWNLCVEQQTTITKETNYLCRSTGKPCVNATDLGYCKLTARTNNEAWNRRQE